MSLCFGPYRAPVLAIGQRANCAIRGVVVVRGYSDAPIRWPRGSPSDDRRAWGMIITGDLLRALTCEMGQDIAAAWGISTKSVTAWRHALKIDGRGLEAIRDYHRRRAKPPPPHILTPEQQARAVARARWKSGVKEASYGPSQRKPCSERIRIAPSPRGWAGPSRRYGASV